MSIRWNHIAVLWRWRIIFFLSLFFIVIAYHYNVRKTVDLIYEFNDLKRRAAASANAVNITSDNTAASNKEADKNPKPIIDVITDYCEYNKLTINSMSQTYFKDTASYTIETNMVTVQGSYNNILQLIYNIETARNNATVASAVFELKKERNTDNSYRLYNTLFIKRLKNE